MANASSVGGSRHPARRVGLVGCVSQKRETRSTAEELYTSALFLGRKQFVSKSCDDWFILSAKHGLVRRSTVLDPYDVALTGRSRSAKRRWTESVLAAIRQQIADPENVTFEIHAGADYFDHGLIDGLQQLGATVEIPTRGLRQGEQLRFYKRHGHPG